LLCAFILLPCACFVVLAPRLFGQGPQWFTLTCLQQSLTGATDAAITSSLRVSGGMWLALLLPSWLLVAAVAIPRGMPVPGAGREGGGRAGERRGVRLMRCLKCCAVRHGRPGATVPAAARAIPSAM
jgi:hypothetical protein